MFYWILLAIVLGLLYIFRKRLANLEGGVIFFVLFIFFIIFIFDWYTGYNLRDYFDLSFYDRTIENPVQVGKDIVQGEVDNIQQFNQVLEDTGAQLDERFGVKQNERGIWGQEHNEDEENSEEEVKSEQTKTQQNNNEIKVGYEGVKEVVNTLNLSTTDKQLVKSLTPLNQGTFKGENVIVKNNDQHIIIKPK